MAKDVTAGEEITEENVRSVRPGDGLHPRFLNQVLGRRASRDLAFGEPLRWDMLRSEVEEGHR